MSNLSLPPSAPSSTAYRRWMAVGASVLVLGVGARVAIRHLAHVAPRVGAPAAPRVSVVTAHAGALPSFQTVDGTIMPANTASLTIPASGVVTVYVTVGTQVSSGQTLAQVTDPTLTSAVQSAAASLSAAEAKLQAATGSLTPAQQKAYNDGIQSAQNALGSAQAAAALADSSTGPQKIALSNAQQDLQFIQSSQSPESVAIANAKTALAAAENQLAQAEAANNASATASAQTAVTTAKATLASAEAAYQAAVVNATDGVNEANAASTSAITQANASVQAAQAAVVKAQDALSVATSPTSAASLSALQAEVAAARQALSTAEQALHAATLVAPFAGTVTAVSVASGAVTQPTMPLLTLTSSISQFTGTTSPASAALMKTGETVHVASGAGSWQVPLTALTLSPSDPALVNILAKLPTGVEALGQPAMMNIPGTVYRGTLVPVVALGYQGSRAFVDVVRHGKIALTFVTVNGTAKGTAAVSGLSGGTVVVDSSPSSWEPGQTVSPVGGAS